MSQRAIVTLVRTDTQVTSAKHMTNVRINKGLKNGVCLNNDDDFFDFRDDSHRHDARHVNSQFSL